MPQNYKHLSSIIFIVQLLTEVTKASLTNMYQTWKERSNNIQLIEAIP